MKHKGKKNKIYRVSKDVEVTNDFIDIINDLLGYLSPRNYTVDRKRFLQLLDNSLLEIYILEDNNSIVGMGSLHYMETLVKKAAWIEDVVVHPEHRKMGHGKKIIKHMISQAKKKGVKHIDLSSRNDRKESHKFYEKLKFDKRDTSVFRKKLKNK